MAQGDRDEQAARPRSGSHTELRKEDGTMLVAVTGRPILPGEFIKIEDVFRDAIRERNLPRSSSEAKALAVRLFELYQNGVDDVVALRAMAKLF
jgi:hypothetical protein